MTPEPERAERTLEGEIEALLFAANAPLDAGEIAELLSVAILDVTRALVLLRGAYARRSGALELSTHPKGANQAYILQVKPAYRPCVERLLPPALGAEELEVLGLIALNQPVPQAKLVRERGPKVYEHVRELSRRGLVARRQQGSTYVLRTTPLFAEEFQLADDPQRIKEVLSSVAPGPSRPPA